MDADGADQTRLTHNAVVEDGPPAWSFDGRRIAFVSARDGDWEIYVMDADGSTQVRLTESPGTDVLPVWMPGGG